MWKTSCRPVWRVGVVALTLLSAASCDDDGPTTTSVTTTGTPPAPALAELVIEQPTPLLAAGETSQLVARAHFSDGSSRDVTNSTRWNGTDAVTIVVSTTGLATAVSLGASYVYAQYQTRTAFAFVKATLPGTFVALGRAREPGQGSIGGATVQEMPTGRSTVTDAGGGFVLGGLTTNRLRIAPAGYEPIERPALQDGFDDFPMQRVVRLQAGASVSPNSLAPNDLVYDLGNGQACAPCRLIRIDAPSSGTLHLSLAWPSPVATLALWVAGQMYSRPVGQSTIEVDVPVSAGQLVTYVEGRPINGHTAFTLNTSFSR